MEEDRIWNPRGEGLRICPVGNCFRMKFGLGFWWPADFRGFHNGLEVNKLFSTFISFVLWSSFFCTCLLQHSLSAPFLTFLVLWLKANFWRVTVILEGVIGFLNCLYNVDAVFSCAAHSFGTILLSLYCNLLYTSLYCWYITILLLLDITTFSSVSSPVIQTLLFFNRNSN